MEDYERHLTEQVEQQYSNTKSLITALRLLEWAGKVALAVLAVAVAWHIAPIVIAAIADPLAQNPY